MRSAPPRFRIRRLSVHEQLAMMRQRWPSFECQITGGVLTCKGHVRPTPLGDSYRVRVRYEVGRPPMVSVLDPPLQRRARDPHVPIPHTFNDELPGEERPCLYVSGEFRSDRWIAITIMPWLYEWLAHYEIWRVTGEWKGGGVEHRAGAKA